TASASGGGLPGTATVLPEPPRAAAERAAGAHRQDPGGAADRRGAAALAGAAGLPTVRQGLSRARPEVPPKAWLGRARGRSAPGPGNRRTVTLKRGLLNQAEFLTVTKGDDDRSRPIAGHRA